MKLEIAKCSTRSSSKNQTSTDMNIFLFGSTLLEARNLIFDTVVNINFI